jgi:hypothetical protein
MWGALQAQLEPEQVDVLNKVRAGRVGGRVSAGPAARPAAASRCLGLHGPEQPPLLLLRVPPLPTSRPPIQP